MPRKVLVKLAFWNPGPIIMVYIKKTDLWKPAPMMGTKEVGTNTFESVIGLWFLLSNGEVPYCVDEGKLAEVLDFPLILRVFYHEVLLCTQKRLTKVHRCCGELPFLSVLVFENQVGSVFWCVVHTAAVGTIRVNVRKVFAGSGVG